MKLSDYIADFLFKSGILHVFVVTGGAAAHLIDSVARHPDIDYVCSQHEQAGAMAADAYARVTGNLGAAMATSGPGVTNMLTGICSAYFDSIPVLYITGQVSTFRNKGDTGVRQIGFQETEVVPMFKPVTNYAVQIRDAKDIRYELEKACYLAKEGRPGPVLIDIPDNLQREEINPEELDSFTLPAKSDIRDDIDKQVDICIKMLQESNRPLVVLGWGIRLAGAVKEVEDFLDTQGIPFVPTWAVADLFPSNHALSIGTFGTHGTRYANFAVQNADFILSIGSRLDTKATGSPVAIFARGARKVMVDIDQNELNKFKKFGLNIDLPVCCDARFFLQRLNERMGHVKKKSISAWIRQIQSWKEKYPICPDDYYNEEDVNPYVFVKTLSQACEEGDVVIVDTGCCLAWTMQTFEFKRNQRLYHDWNNTAMGWALPASIGASFAKNKSRIICITGDGSLQMNIQELATIIKHKLPVKIFLLNNKGYSMIRQTQDQWLDSNYEASSIDGGLADLDYLKIAEAYGFPVFSISKNRDMDKRINMVLENESPAFCNVDINYGHRVIPQAKYGRPNEDQEPLLERKEFFKNMIIPPLKVSFSE